MILSLYYCVEFSAECPLLLVPEEAAPQLCPLAADFFFFFFFSLLSVLYLLYKFYLQNWQWAIVC